MVSFLGLSVLDLIQDCNTKNIFLMTLLTDNQNNINNTLFNNKTMIPRILNQFEPFTP